MRQCLRQRPIERSPTRRRKFEVAAPPNRSPQSVSMIRKIFAGMVAVAAVSGLFGVPVATADTVRQTFSCFVPKYGWYPRDYFVTINVPTTVTKGQPTSAYIRIQSPYNNTTASPPVSGIAVRIQLGGASTELIQVENLANPGVPAGQPWFVERTANLTFSAAGSTTLTGAYLFVGSTPPGCKPGPVSPVAETVNVVP
jgi:hypothetical protein